MSRWENVWEFNTKRFAVVLSVTDEDDDPANQFECEDDIEFARKGGWHWFQARMQVVFKDNENPKHWAVQRNVVLGEDYLGGCSYYGLADFKNGGYFRDMVAEAIREARAKIGRIKG